MEHKDKPNTKSLEEVIAKHLGNKCDVYEDGCATCEIWEAIALKDQAHKAEVEKARREQLENDIAVLEQHAANRKYYRGNLMSMINRLKLEALTPLPESDKSELYDTQH